MSYDGRIYFRTGIGEVKYANLQANPRVLVLVGDTGWEGGLDVTVEGTAAPVVDGAVLRRIGRLYGTPWDGRWELHAGDDDARAGTLQNPVVTFEVTPHKAFAFQKGDPSGQTTYYF